MSPDSISPQGGGRGSSGRRTRIARDRSPQVPTGTRAGSSGVPALAAGGRDGSTHHWLADTGLMSTQRFRPDASGQREYDDTWLIKHGLSFKPEALAVAAGVSVRTAYRYKAAFTGDLVTVRVGNWGARFAVRRGKPPVRIGPWEMP